MLGSGSRGNCCAVEFGGTAILLDAGFSAREIERRAETVGPRARPGSPAIALTHEHGDHACGAPPAGPAPRRAGADRARHLGPARAGMREPTTARWLCSARSSSGRSGSTPAPPATTRPIRWRWRSTPATAASVGVAYDLGRPTTAVRYLLRNLTAIVLEANHDEVQLRTSELSAGRAAPDRGLRQATCATGRRRSCSPSCTIPGLAVVVLAHLSQRCNTAADARAAVAPGARRVGFAGALHVAAQDVPLGPIDVVAPGRMQFRLGAVADGECGTGGRTRARRCRAASCLRRSDARDRAGPPPNRAAASGDRRAGR